MNLCFSMPYLCTKKNMATNAMDSQWPPNVQTDQKSFWREAVCEAVPFSAATSRAVCVVVLEKCDPVRQLCRHWHYLWWITKFIYPASSKPAAERPVQVNELESSSPCDAVDQALAYKADAWSESLAYRNRLAKSRQQLRKTAFNSKLLNL